MRLILLLCLCLVPLPVAAEVRITGEMKYKPHSLVRLRAEGVDAKAALLWRVYPSKDVQRATTPRGVLEFAAHPGTYEVELLVIRQEGDALSVEEARVTVTIDGCTPVPPSPPPPTPPPPSPKPPPEGKGKLDPVNAIVRIQFGAAGCSATIIGPQRADGRWDILTAAHCIEAVGDRGTAIMADGRRFAVRVAVREKGPDVAWLVTEDRMDDLPYARLAERDPEVGVKVWHKGFGVDKPGNREDGEVAEKPNAFGQTRFILSVSSGDSGGGILRDDNNEVVSTVCCTSGMARKVSMWGGSVEVIRKTRPTGAISWDKIDASPPDRWEPVPIPKRIYLPYERGTVIED